MASKLYIHYIMCIYIQHLLPPGRVMLHNLAAWPETYRPDAMRKIPPTASPKPAAPMHASSLAPTHQVGAGSQAGSGRHRCARARAALTETKIPVYVDAMPAGLGSISATGLHRHKLHAAEFTCGKPAGGLASWWCIHLRGAAVDYGSLWHYRAQRCEALLLLAPTAAHALATAHTRMDGKFVLVSSGLHCFLQAPSAGLIVVLVPGCCWVY